MNLSKSKTNKLLSIFFSLLLLFLSATNLYLGIKKGEIINSIALDMFLLFWAYKIIYQKRWALHLLVIILFFFSISLVGVFSPFTAGDYLTSNITPPSISDTLLWFIPTELILLLLIYFINPIKED